MVFKIKSQYIDSAGKLRIIYGYFNSQFINLLTFPLPPLDNVPIETESQINSLHEIGDTFIDDFNDELKGENYFIDNSGLWFKNFVFPPFVFIPLDKNLVPSNISPLISFPLMIEGSPQSSLDVYKDRVHKANIFKQYVLFLYSCDPHNYSLENSFVINDNPNYEFDKWDPPNWLSLENEKMVVLDESKEETHIQLIVPNEDFKKRLDFYLRKELQVNKDLVDTQKNRETIPHFYKFKTNFKKWDNIHLFSSPEGLKQWVRYKNTSKEYFKCLVSSTFHPSETDLARLDSKDDLDDLDFPQELLEPYFFHHYNIKNGALALVQNVLSSRHTFDGNLFQALVVSRIWVLYQMNRAPVEDRASNPLPGLEWGVSADDLEIEIKQKDEKQIFEDYNVVVYSSNGEIVNDTIHEPPQAYLIQYREGGYAALLFVSTDLYPTGYLEPRIFFPDPPSDGGSGVLTPDWPSFFSDGSPGSLDSPRTPPSLLDDGSGGVLTPVYGSPGSPGSPRTPTFSDGSDLSDDGSGVLTPGYISEDDPEYKGFPAS